MNENEYFEGNDKTLSELHPKYQQGTSCFSLVLVNGIKTALLLLLCAREQPEEFEVFSQNLYVCSLLDMGEIIYLFVCLNI